MRARLPSARRNRGLTSGRDRCFELGLVSRPSERPRCADEDAALAREREPGPRATRRTAPRDSALRDFFCAGSRVSLRSPGTRAGCEVVTLGLEPVILRGYIKACGSTYDSAKQAATVGKHAKEEKRWRAYFKKAD